MEARGKISRTMGSREGHWKRHWARRETGLVERPSLRNVVRWTGQQGSGERAGEGRKGAYGRVRQRSAFRPSRERRCTCKRGLAELRRPQVDAPLLILVRWRPRHLMPQQDLRDRRQVGKDPICPPHQLPLQSQASEPNPPSNSTHTPLEPTKHPQIGRAHV